MGGYAEGYGGGYRGGYAEGIEIPQEKEYHPAVAVSSWKFPGEPAAIMPENPEIMEDPEPRDAEIAESEPIGEFSAADDGEQNRGTTTNATSVSGDDVSDKSSEDHGYRESEPLPTVQEMEPMVFTREPEPMRALSPVPSLRREYKPRRRHTTGADTSVPSSHYRPRIPHRHTFNEGQEKEHKDSSHDHHHHHKRTKSHDPQSHKQPLLFSIFYAVTKTHAGPQTRRMPSSSPHRSSTRGKSTTRASTRPSTARSSSSSRSPSVSTSNKHDISSTKVAVPKTSTQKPTTKKAPITSKSTTKSKKPLAVPTASETTVVVPLDTGVPSVIAPPGKATITKTKKFNSKIKSEKEIKVDSKKMIKGWLAGMQEPAAVEGEKKMKSKSNGKERGRRMTK